MVQGTVEYLFGSLNMDIAPTQGTLISDSAAGTTGTATVQILSGNVPLPGSLITIVGSSNNANFNVTNAVTLTVSAANVPDNGVYILTFTMSATTQATLADTGQFIIPQPEVGDVLTSAIISALPVSSAPITSPAAGPNSVGKSLSATVTLPAASAAIPNTLSGVTVVLQGSNKNVDADFNTIATIGTGLAAGSTTQWQSGQGDTATGTLASGSVDLINFLFYRMKVTAGGGAGPIVGKLLQ
jgi:hypothetical protein